MATILSIRTTGFLKTGRSRSITKLQRVPKLLPSAMMEWGKKLETDMKLSAAQAGIKSSTGGLFGSGIRWKQRPKGKKGELFIRQYGIYLDEMKPHWVSMKRSRTRFVRWGMKASNRNIRAAATKISQGSLKRYGVFVKPHPFIQKGYTRARRKLKPIISKHLRRAIRDGV